MAAGPGERRGDEDVTFEEEDVLGVAAEATEDEEEIPEWARDDVEPEVAALSGFPAENVPPKSPEATAHGAAAPAGPPGSFSPAPRGGPPGALGAGSPKRDVKLAREVDPDKAKAVEELKAAILKAANKPSVPKPPRPEVEALLALCGCIRKLAAEQPLFRDVAEALPRLGEDFFAPLIGIRQARKIDSVAKAAPAPGAVVRVTGRVKSYNQRKGFGFIDIPGYPRDIFVYNAHLIGRTGLVAGEAVSFELCVDGGRPQARQVRPAPGGVVQANQQVPEPSELPKNPLSAMKQGMAMAQSQVPTPAQTMQELAMAMATAAEKHRPTRPPKPQRDDSLFDKIAEAQAKAQAANTQATNSEKRQKNNKGARASQAQGVGRAQAQEPPGNFNGRIGPNPYQVMQQPAQPPAQPPARPPGVMPARAAAPPAAAAPAGFTDMGKIPRGTTVRITNFPAAEVNDCLGVVQGYDAATERYSVSVDIGHQADGSSEVVPLQLKEEFLKVEPQQAPTAGKMSLFDQVPPQQRPAAGPAAAKWLGGPGPMRPVGPVLNAAAVMGPLEPSAGYAVGVVPGAPRGPAAGAATAGGDLAQYAQAAAAMRSFLSAPMGAAAPPQMQQPRPMVGGPGPLQMMGQRPSAPGAGIAVPMGAGGVPLQPLQPAGAAQPKAGHAAAAAGSRPTVDRSGQMVSPLPGGQAAAAASAAGRQRAGQPPPEGHPGQLWRVLRSRDFNDVIVRETQDVSSKELRRIMPGEVCMQRGQTVALSTGLVRMPVLPDGWVTLHARFVGGPTFFEETTMTQDSMPGAINEEDFARAAEKKAREEASADRAPAEKGPRKKEARAPALSAKDAETFGDAADAPGPWAKQADAPGKGGDAPSAPAAGRASERAPEREKEKKKRSKAEPSGPSYGRSWLLSAQDALRKASRLETPDPGMAGFRTLYFPPPAKERDRDRDRRRERRAERAAAAQGEPDAEVDQAPKEDKDRERRRDRRDKAEGEAEERERPRRRDRQRRREREAEETRAAEMAERQEAPEHGGARSGDEPVAAAGGASASSPAAAAGPAGAAAAAGAAEPPPAAGGAGRGAQGAEAAAAGAPSAAAAAAAPADGAGVAAPGGETDSAEAAEKQKKNCHQQ